MARTNQGFGCNLNCSLVSYYKNGEVSARLHRDDEEELEQNQPIVVVSLGAVRSVEFVDNRQESFRRNALTTAPKEGSVYVMRAGCQQKFRHRVRMCKRVKDYRISLSFRAFVPQMNRASSTMSMNVSNAEAEASDCSFTTPNSKVSNTSVAPDLSPIAELPSSTSRRVSPVIVKPLKQLLPQQKPPIYPTGSTPFKRRSSPPTPPAMSPNPMAKNPPIDLPRISNPVECGYSPFPSHMNSSKLTSNAENPCPNEKICVIFGTSMTERVNPALMSKRNRTVENVSSSGANIDDIRKLAGDFHHENIKSIHKIDKLIISVGTNDVKWFNCFTKDLKRELQPKLVRLVQELKVLYPSAQILFHTVLPIRIIYKYTAASIHQFNNLLLEICFQYGCIFFDCFARFLDQKGVFYNRTLFRDNFHLNDIGLKVFC